MKLSLLKKSKINVTPLLVFVLLSIIIYVLYTNLNFKENYIAQEMVEDELNQLEVLLATRAKERLLSIERMAKRWEIAKGLDYTQWREDALNHIKQVPGLRTLEWVDSSFHIKWVEPIQSNSTIVGLDVLLEPKRANLLKQASNSFYTAYTPPLQLIEGYTGIGLYVPLKIDNKFNGFIVGYISLGEFIQATLPDDLMKNFDINVSQKGINFFHYNDNNSMLVPEFKTKKTFTLFNNEWEVTLIPSTKYLSNVFTHLPEITLLGGLFIAALLSLILRLMILSRIKHREIEVMKDQFISVVSHELRTPLTSIRGSLGIMLQTMLEVIPDKGRELIKIAYQNSERLMNLINDILDIDKISMAKFDLSLKVHELPPLIKESITQNKEEADKKNIGIMVSEMSSNLKIKVDAGRFIQILNNLISNAIKFSNPDSKIYINTQVQQNRVLIQIKDEGCGIKKEYQKKLFDKFSQGDSSKTRAKGGTGVGLYMAKYLVEKMNGKIDFETQVNHGATFKLWFNLVKG